MGTGIQITCFILVLIFCWVIGRTISYRGWEYGTGLAAGIVSLLIVVGLHA